MEFDFPLLEIPEEFGDLRREVRAFVGERSAAWSGADLGRSWMNFDREFSRAVGQRGWIGMTWPKAYGGHERTPVERAIVLEEMLAASAPVGAHWIGDRQSGPLILRVGTPEQRKRFLPRIAAGEISFCIGLSEPGAGSDLASLRSRATRVEGGWKLNGRKIWTTHAHQSDFMIGLFRSQGSPVVEKHKGLSQFLIDLQSSGLEVRRIVDLTGDAHFNEITFDDVFVPDDMIMGAEGEGWAQVNAELAFERSGPDRYMSSFALLPAAIDAVRDRGDADRLAARGIGQSVAELVVLREMSLSVLGRLGAGDAPALEAALTKDLGTGFEQRLPEMVREVVGVDGAAVQGDRLSEMQSYLTQISGSFSLRGGTREIMRGLIARGLGLR